MADLVSAVNTEARALLNDVSAGLYTDERLLTFINKAYREMQDNLNLNGLQHLDEIAAYITVLAGATTIGTPPADMIRPTEVAERPSGTADQFVALDNRTWLPDEPANQSLRYWVWREEAIELLAATSSRQVRVRYLKSLPALTGSASTILVTNAVSFLAARSAALAARYIGENETRANSLDSEAVYALGNLVRLNVRMNQGRPTRRRRTRYNGL